MKKVAFIFPGQGSQAVGMGKDLYDSFEVSKHVFDKANEVLGKDIKHICFEGDEEVLKQTVNTQPAILTTSIACFKPQTETPLKNIVKNIPANKIQKIIIGTFDPKKFMG